MEKRIVGDFESLSHLNNSFTQEQLEEQAG